MEEKSNRNKTIRLSEEELNYFKEKVIIWDKNKIWEKYTQYPKNVTINSSLLFLINTTQNYPQKFVDLIFIDPPYNLNKTFNQNKFTKMDDSGYEDFIHTWILMANNLLKENGSIYICSDWKTSPIIYKVLSKYFIIRNRITWEREKGRGAKTNWKNCHEDIWFATKSNDYYFNVNDVKIKKKVIAPYKDKFGKAKDWNENEQGKYRLTYPSNLWTDLTVPFWSMAENTEHPTQKPEKLLAKIILASSKPGDLIFDPSCGSGTTSVVAKKLNRNYIGIEKDFYYCCLTEKRLELVGKNKIIQGYENNCFMSRNYKLKD